MDIKIEKQEKSQIKLEIELSKEEFAGFYEQALSDIGKEVEIKGFRKGKAPKDIVEKTVGRERILVDAGDLAVHESYRKAVKEKNLEAISRPEVKIKKIGFEDSLIYEVVFSVMPEVELGDYKKISSSVKRENTEVTEKDIEGALKWVQRSRAKYSAKLTPAQTGDFVEIEYWSPDVHEIGEDHKKKDAFILGEGHFFDGFEGIISGMKPGEEKKEIELEIPKEHSFKKVAGKKIKFSIKLESVQKVEFPELTDEFAKTLGNFENIEGLKKSIKDGIKSEKDFDSAKKARSEATEKISEASKAEILEVLVQRESEKMLEDFKHDVFHRMGMPFEEYLKKINKTEEDLKKMIIPEAEKKVKNYLILQEIGKKEGVFVSEEEVEDETNKALKYYTGRGQKIDPDQLKDYTREAVKTEKIYKIIDGLISK